MSRRVSDRALRRWLATGRPSRIARLVADDQSIAARLDELTSLTAGETTALEDLVTPSDDFERRTAIGVQQRVDAYGTTAAVVDLLGLGFHVGRAVMGDRRKNVRDEGSGRDAADPNDA